MKTFREFVEEAYLYEMRKEDKVKGKKKTPLYDIKTTASVQRRPEGSDKKWEVKKTTTKNLSRGSYIGRTKQGMRHPDRPTETLSSTGGALQTYARHGHGGGGYGAKASGRLRGVGKLEKQKMDKEQRDRGERPFTAGPSPAQKVAAKRARRNRSYGGY